MLKSKRFSLPESSVCVIVDALSFHKLCVFSQLIGWSVCYRVPSMRVP